MVFFDNPVKNWGQNSMEKLHQNLYKIEKNISIKFYFTLSKLTGNTVG
jgi:hypothetical protein